MFQKVLYLGARLEFYIIYIIYDSQKYHEMTNIEGPIENQFEEEKRLGNVQISYLFS